jgi:DNA invertase Pin-like site-specific DNA recombinase
MMIVGYARTSTVEQEAGFDAQLRALKEAGAEKVFQEQVSSVQQRAELMRALDFVREGDVFLVTKLDRLARSVEHLISIVDTLERKKVTLRIQNLNLDTSTPTGKLMLNVMGSIAQFEREIMLERQREGIAKAKAEGKYKGRAPTARIKADRVRELKANGMTVAAIAKELKISVRSTWRILSAN